MKDCFDFFPNILIKDKLFLGNIFDAICTYIKTDRTLFELEPLKLEKVFFKFKK